MNQYTVIDALGQLLGNTAWTSIEHSGEMAVSQIFKEYQAFHIKLKRNSNQDILYLDLFALYNSHQNYFYTLDVLLNQLPMVSNLWLSTWIKDDLKYIRYEDLMACGYRFRYSKLGYNQTHNLTLDDKVDLKIEISNPLLNTALIHQQAIVSINGLLHQTHREFDNTYLINGARTAQSHPYHPSIGVYSIPSKYPLLKAPMGADRLIVSPKQTAFNECFIDLPEANDKDAIIVSLLGRLYLTQYSSLKRVSPNVLRLRMNDPDWTNHCLRQYRLLKNSPFVNEAGYLDSSLMNQLSNVQWIFDHPLSFITIIPETKLSIETIELRPSQIPYQFTSYQEPIYPLTLGQGELMEYRKSLDEGLWGIETRPIQYGRYLHSDHRYQALSLNKAIVPGIRPMTARFLKIGLY